MLLKILDWLAVVAISVALVVGLIMFLEARDPSAVRDDSAAPVSRV